jgi:predicted PurR-regulated permease PerM
VFVIQVGQLAVDLPTYQANLRSKIQSLRGATEGPGTLDRASEMLQELRREIDKPQDEKPAAPGAQTKPIPVEVRQPDPGPLQTLVLLSTPLIGPVTTAGIAIIFVIFILMKREDLRNRIVRLAGTSDLQRTTAALNEAGGRLGRLFMTQLALNAAFGLVIGLGLWLIGVPSPALWGILAMIMRFVPYVGAFVSAALPLALAAAVGPDWSMALWTGALFLIVEPLVGHVIEPLVYGHSAGLSPVAVLAAAAFWTWLWGPIGLILATPLTICLMVLGRHVDQLKFLEVMLGSEPPLTQTEVLYQRLLASDPVEAYEQARSYLKENTLLTYYEDVLLPGVQLAQVDVARGRLDMEGMRRIREGVAELIDDLEPHEGKREISQDEDDEAGEKQSPLAKLEQLETAPARQLPARWRGEKSVICVPGGSLLDEAAVLIVADLLKREGVGVATEDSDVLSMSRLFGWDPAGAQLICLCYVQGATAPQVRYAVRRLRRRAPDAQLMVSLLGNAEAADELKARAVADFVEATLGKTIDRALALARGASERAQPDRSDRSLQEGIAAATG